MTLKAARRQDRTGQVCAQYVCDVGVVYNMPVHLFVHGAKQTTRNWKAEDNKSIGKKDVMRVPINGFETTPS